MSILCEGRRFDALAFLRGEIFVFKKEFVWRLTDDFHVVPGYPVRFNEIFQGIPSHVQHIDAAYERSSDGAIVLFHGIFVAYFICYLMIMHFKFSILSN